MSTQLLHTKKNKQKKLLHWLSLLVCVGCIGLFIFSISRIEAQNDIQQQEHLQEAVSRSIVTCYTLEGFYPESLAYLEEHYGLTYDKDTYYIDYQPIGSNLMPDVTIIKRKEA
ncbi:MAG: hypothetical protein PHC41_05935 [Lachnospiraceae bacterium]|nr:hypothetical protein [Lachnospiraceae bacterium]MDD3615752.1 hypothetical protein [Lachnospiraceae bacterium]